MTTSTANPFVRAIIAGFFAFALMGLVACSDDKSSDNAEPVEEVDANLITDIDDIKLGTVRIEASGKLVDLQDIDSARKTKESWSGSGFFVSSDGYLVTNNHVAAGASKIEISIGDDRDTTYSAEVVGQSECSDLALLKVEPEDDQEFRFFEFGDDPETNTDLRTAGFPNGTESFTTTAGIISQASAPGNQPWTSVEKTVEIDARINPGNSGGPSVDNETVKVIGVNYAGGQQLETTGRNFAIAPSVAVPLIEQLKDGDQESLGLNSVVIPLDESGDTTGLFVQSVKKGSVADKTGIEPGDIILKLDSKSLGRDGTMKDYCSILRKKGTDAKLKVQVYRPSEGRTYNGRLNSSDDLEPDKEVIYEDNSNADTGLGQTTAADYNVVVDDLNKIQVEVPKVWTAITTAPDDGKPVIIATSDAELFSQSLDAPNKILIGGILVASPAKQIDDVQEYLTPKEPAERGCRFLPYEDYSDETVLQGVATKACNNGAYYYLYAATNIDRTVSLVMYASVTTDLEYEYFVHALETVTLAD
jgi:serine protease Do